MRFLFFFIEHFTPSITNVFFNILFAIENNLLDIYVLDRSSDVAATGSELGMLL